MKKFVHDELCAVLPRAKKRLIQRFGRWYYEPITEEDFESRFENLVKVVPKIKNEEEFDELIRETHDIVYELDNGQPFKIVLVEDSHIPNASFMMICIHHVFGDGIIWIGCVNAVADNGFVDLAKFARSAGFNPLLDAAGIVRGMKAFFDLLVNFDFSKKRAPEPKREYVLSRKFDMGKMKAACKGLKTPF